MRLFCVKSQGMTRSRDFHGFGGEVKAAIACARLAGSMPAARKANQCVPLRTATTISTATRMAATPSMIHMIRRTLRILTASTGGGGSNSNGGTLLRREHALLLQTVEQRHDSLFEPTLDG